MAATATTTTRIRWMHILKARWRTRPRLSNAMREFSFVLRETVQIFVAHPIPLLSAGVLGLGGAALIGNLLFAALILDVYGRIGSYFTSSMNILLAQMCVQAVVGFLLMSLSRGAITWIGAMALQSPNAPTNDPNTVITLKNAFRAARRNWKPLLVSALIYGVLMSLAVAGITYALRELHLDLSNYRMLRSEAGSISSALTVRGLDISVPDPGSPFSEIRTYLRFTLSRTTSSVYFSWLGLNRTVGKASIPIALVLLGSSTLVLIFDTLLCFRHVEIMRHKRAGALSWLVSCVQLAHAHFWRVASARLGLRLMTYSLTLFCLTLPMTLQQGFLLPKVVAYMENYLPYALNNAAANIVLALANGVFVAFGLVFDARLSQRIGSTQRIG